MKKSARPTPNATIGTCTADLGERGKFVGDEKKMKLYKDPGEGRWYAMATHNVEKDKPHYYDLAFVIPDEGNVADKVYEIDDDFHNLKTVKATFWERNGPGAEAFIAKSGRLTFTINESTGNATATFEFQTDKQVTVTEGKFDLEGFDPSLMVSTEHKAFESFTADIQDGEFPKNYSAVEFSLTRQEGNEINFPLAHWLGWSKQPGTPNAVISLFVATTLDANKEYTLSRNSNEVRAMYIDFDASGIRSYLSIGGTLKLDSIPLEDSSLCVLKGSIEFEAERSDGSKTISVKKGLFHFDGTKHPA
ncbi:hypothetical protein [Pseudomonas sp. URMO17WK12:I12]|uniref:hypothetical protein n=1 Tax=Pseudomonas sp. URMO17WK12:I12 TaxID=1259797 RepID=UPI0012DFE5C0|nr:hypothetical protein [Pseudomonas sp. URMO17WK12:I12]